MGCRVNGGITRPDDRLRLMISTQHRLPVDVNIVPNPADGLARVLGERCGKNMGFGKNLFDFSALVISLAIGMIGAGRPVGIGSGTVVAMVCTGRVIALFNYFGKKKIEEITIA